MILAKISARKNLTRNFTACAVCCLSLLCASSVSARDHGYHGNGGHHYGGRHYGGRHHGGHHYRGHYNYQGAYFAGGLILGSLIARSHHRYQEPVVVQRTVVGDPVVVTRKPGRRLFRDRNGNCFERTRSSQGDELMLELDPAECAW